MPNWSVVCFLEMLRQLGIGNLAVKGISPLPGMAKLATLV
jgi:hypothetical protein